MKEDRERVIAILELVAAKAKRLAMDVRDHKLWERDLSNGVGQLRSELAELSGVIARNDQW